MPSGFEDAVRNFIRIFPKRLKQYGDLLSGNPIYLSRTRGIGPISGPEAVRWGLSGPNLRAAGVDFDLRKSNPYSGYERYEFDVPVGSNGDVYDRYQMRLQEMGQALRIVAQALDSHVAHHEDRQPPVESFQEPQELLDFAALLLHAVQRQGMGGDLHGDEIDRFIPHLRQQPVTYFIITDLTHQDGLKIMTEQHFDIMGNDMQLAVITFI